MYVSSIITSDASMCGSEYERQKEDVLRTNQFIKQLPAPNQTKTLNTPIISVHNTPPSLSNHANRRSHFTDTPYLLTPINSTSSPALKNAALLPPDANSSPLPLAICPYQNPRPGPKPDTLRPPPFPRCNPFQDQSTLYRGLINHQISCQRNQQHSPRLRYQFALLHLPA